MLLILYVIIDCFIIPLNDLASAIARVFLPTGTGPETAVTGATGPDRFRYRPVANRPNSKFKFELKKMKNSQKIPKNTSRCDESNGVKNFQIFVHLVYLAGM